MADDRAYFCEHCGVPIVNPSPRKKYCGRTCLEQASRHRTGAKKPRVNKRTPAEVVQAHTVIRRGPTYKRLLEEGWLRGIIAGDFTNKQVAEQTGIAGPSVSKALGAYKADVIAEATKATNTPDDPTVADFARWRKVHFKTLDGKPYQTTAFHKRWVAALLKAVLHGQRLAILSPPRHGKTDLLIHFCLYLICTRPNIRLAWFGASQDLAKKALNQMRMELETNETLLRDYGGATGFRPQQRSGMPWSNIEFVVATRTIASKSPTMVAVGRGGTTLGRDLDGMVGDDIQDHDAVASPVQRDRDWEWWRRDVGSRKTKSTFMAYIGSRQHSDDIARHMLENKAWDVIVEHAHDPACLLDPEDRAAHRDCMLWPDNPELDYAWLMDQRDSYDNQTLWEMVYQNIAEESGGRAFTLDAIMPCMDRSRVLGDPPGGTRLIAGLDPAPVAWQAAVLWAVDLDTGVRYLLDVDLQQGGGLEGAERIIKAWHRQYGCREWVIETMNYQTAILQAKEIKDYCHRANIQLRKHWTQASNKYDPMYGIPATGPLFTGGKVVLPYGDEYSRRQVDLYVRQLLNWEPTRASRGRGPSDLVMAGWFPETEIRKWLDARAAQNSQLEYVIDEEDYPWSSLADLL